METSDEVIQQYINEMTEMEKTVMEIAREHLGSSFCIENSVGFSNWLKYKNKKEDVQTDNIKLKIYGTRFIKSNQFGDFNWMCLQTIYSNSLFIFNDNEEYHNTARSGMGNAIIRKFNSYNPNLDKPLSAGIPTGTLKKGGYRILDSHVINVVNLAINKIKLLISKYNYESIYYSVGKDGKLGTGLFTVHHDVINYINEQISSLSPHPIILINNHLDKIN